MHLAPQLLSLTLCALVPALAAAQARPAAAGAGGALPPLLARERETALALSAAPPMVAKNAAVLVLARGGYVEVRAGTNGFTCLVERSSPTAVEPICYGEEASASVLPRALKEARLREEGKTAEEVAQLIAEDYRRGALRAPRPGAIAYMLATESQGFDSTTGRTTPIPPHVMFYVPYLTNADLGFPAGGPPAEKSGPPFVVSEGEPTAFVVVWSDSRVRP